MTREGKWPYRGRRLHARLYVWVKSQVKVMRHMSDNIFLVASIEW
jgi:hypothetical protein